MIQFTLCHSSKPLNLGVLTTNNNYPILSAIIYPSVPKCIGKILKTQHLPHHYKKTS